jgi:hypothetical protein
MLTLKNSSLTRFAAVGRLFSNANIGFEFGQRGTTAANLVKEQFFN